VSLSASVIQTFNHPNLLPRQPIYTSTTSTSIFASVLWITKHAKDHEKHETLSRLSPPFVSFVIQTLHHPNLPLRQPIHLIHHLIQLPLPLRHLRPLALCIQQLAHQGFNGGALSGARHFLATSVSRAVLENGLCLSCAIHRKCLAPQTPSTTPISPSINPYNSYTSISIC
jgi:hypothetical protein